MTIFPQKKKKRFAKKGRFSRVPAAFFFPSCMTTSQSTNTIALVQPAGFALNPQAADNQFIDFETRISNPQEKALQQFQAFADMLKKNDIEVIVLKDTPTPHTPDSIFPNNVISTHEDGTVIFYPMYPQNRYDEVKKHQAFLSFFSKKGYRVQEIKDYSSYREQQVFLEGTGSMVLDRKNKVAYACLSDRTSAKMLDIWCHENGYTAFPLHAFYGNDSAQKMPIYHTNVLMSIGEKFTAICLEAIPDSTERKNIERALLDTGKEIIELSVAQIGAFAANMLQVKNVHGKSFVVLSEQALKSLSAEQKDTFSRLELELLATDLSCIEEIGGGSARCMMLEIFLPRL